MIRGRKAISQVLAIALMTSTLTVNASALEPRADVSSATLAGIDRYETAVKVSESGWTSATNAVIINGDKGLVDALTATPYASLKNAPILVTEQGKLPKTTKDRLKALNVKNVDIVGGEAVVSLAVENELKAMGLTVKRIQGKDRYDTALAVANEIHKLSSVTKIAVVNGATGLPDAVSIAASAADNKMPILLSDPNKGLEASKTFMTGKNISKSYVIGQTNAVSDAIMNTLPGVKTRLGGTDRHDTNAKVIKEFYTSSSLDNIYVAKSGYVKNNQELVDALAVGVLAAKNDDPVLIVGNSLGDTQKSLLKDKKFTKITQVGNGIPTASIQAIKDTQKDPEAVVSGVTLVDYTTIKLTGSELGRIDKSKVSISGNTVKSYTANSEGTSATVVFEKVFSNGTNTVSVTSNLGNVKTHTFTVDTAVTKVEASTKEVGTSGLQKVGFTVNDGKTMSIEALKTLGWKVEFISNDPVFYKSSSTGSTTSVDGSLRTSHPFGKGSTFSYKVTLTKDKETLTSAWQTVEVVEAIYTEITSYDFKLTSGNTLGSGNKMVVKETAKIENVKAKDANNKVYTVSESNYTVKSDKSDVVMVQTQSSGSPKYIIKAVGKGKANITISNGAISKVFSVEVVEGGREVSKVTLSTTELNLVAGSPQTKISAYLEDQHGAPVSGQTLVISSDAQVSGSTTTIATLSTSNTDAEGKTTIDITPHATSTGSAIVPIKFAGKTYHNLKINVNNNKVIHTYKLEAVAGKDLILDAYVNKAPVTDKTVVVNLNEYNASNQFIGTTTGTITTKSTLEDKPTTGTVLTISNAKVADVTSILSGNIVIEGKKAGTSTIKAYVNGVEKASIVITVNDSTPKMTGIKSSEFNSVVNVTTTDGSIDVIEKIFTIRDITTSKSVVMGVEGTDKEVLFKKNPDGTAILFVDDINENGGFDSGETIVATVEIETSWNPGSPITNIKSVALPGQGATENNEQILVKIYQGIDNTVTPLITSIINITIPAIASR